MVGPNLECRVEPSRFFIALVQTYVNEDPHGHCRSRRCDLGYCHLGGSRFGHDRLGEGLVPATAVAD